MYNLLALFVLARLFHFAFSTCSSGPIIKDGGFESGVTPPTSGGDSWTVVGFVGSSTYSLTTPGSTNNGGRFAFTASLAPGARTGGQSAETLVQTLNTCAGLNYSILMDYKFDQTASNLCSVRIEYPYKTTSGSVTVGSGLGTPGVWYQTGSFFQAVSSSSLFRIVFGCNGSANDKISVDNVKVALFNGNAY